MFDWLKRQVRNAVLDGINEAIAELAGAHREERQEPPVVLLLPSPEEETPRKKKSS